MRTALDTNILSAFWSNESMASQVDVQLSQARAQGSVVICAPVYAELFAHPRVNEQFIYEFLRDTGITVDFVLQEDVWRRAAAAYASYAQRRRKSGGKSPKRMLVDFVVGAHALLHADRLLTLDRNAYKQNYPSLRVVHPGVQ